jgi:hypothetical protein
MAELMDRLLAPRPRTLGAFTFNDTSLDVAGTVVCALFTYLQDPAAILAVIPEMAPFEAPILVMINNFGNALLLPVTQQVLALKLFCICSSGDYPNVLAKRLESILRSHNVNLAGQALLRSVPNTEDISSKRPYAYRAAGRLLDNEAFRQSYIFPFFYRFGMNAIVDIAAVLRDVPDLNQLALLRNDCRKYDDAVRNIMAQGDDFPYAVIKGRVELSSVQQANFPHLYAVCALVNQGTIDSYSRKVVKATEALKDIAEAVISYLKRDGVEEGSSLKKYLEERATTKKRAEVFRAEEVEEAA